VRVRDLERLLGRKTMEVGILKEALELARAIKPILPPSSVPPDEAAHRDARSRSLELSPGHYGFLLRCIEV
jgi:hypothetical protein